MATIGDKLAEEHYAKNPDADKNAASRFAKAIARHGIPYCPDFKRIERLPRRHVGVPHQIDLEMNATFAKPEGRMSLRPIQVAALAEIYEWKGLVGAIGVGEGKALVSLLAPSMVDAERPLLLVPAQLRDQTIRKVIPEMSKHWHLPTMKIFGYEELSLAAHADFLDEYKPDLIVADEAQYLAGTSSGRTRRVHRYMAEHPETMFVALTGSLTKRSLRDYWHLVKWALKDTMTPMPLTWVKLQDWADALDEEIRDERLRVAPGALKRLCIGNEDVRSGYRRRLSETPGYISTTNSAVTASLNIFTHRPRLVPEIHAPLERLKASWELPNGDYVTEAIDLWRHMREISCGFYYHWNPAPPEEWLEARRNWKRYVRDRLQHNRSNLDTELQVWNEATREDVLPEFVCWREVKDSFKPNVEPVWISDFLVDYIITHVAMRGPSIVWTEHDAFAMRLAEKSGWQYFGAGDDSIVDADGKQPIIASIRAHSTGKNLQHAFSRNVVASCPPGGSTWEQILGRTHRMGQPADEVTADVFLHTEAMIDAWRRAHLDARYIEDTTGQRQKLNYATEVNS